MNDLDGMKIIGQVKQDKTLPKTLNEIATNDFCYLVQKSGMSTFTNLHHIVVNSSSGSAKTIGSCYVVGVEKDTNMVQIPRAEIDSEPNGFLVFVCYKDGNVQGVYVFKNHEVIKCGLLSRFKCDKKNNVYIAKTDSLEKCTKNRFGVVFAEDIK